MRRVLDPLAHLLARGERTEAGCLVLPDKDPGAYQTVKAFGRTVKAHRFVFEQEHGATDLYILHRCDVPGCFEITHLFAGTQADNMNDMYGKQRRDQSMERNGNWRGGKSWNARKRVAS